MSLQIRSRGQMIREISKWVRAATASLMAPKIQPFTPTRNRNQKGFVFPFKASQFCMSFIRFSAS